MSNQKSAIALIKSISGQANLLTIPRIYVDFTGSLDGALLLSQCIYWSDRGGAGDGWFYKTYQEWKEEICLSEYEVSKQVVALKKLGIIETKLKKANGAPTVHYRVDFDAFLKSITEFLDNRKPTNSRMESQESGQSLTETTPETSTENPLSFPVRDYLSDIQAKAQSGVNESTAPNPVDQYWQYRGDALKAAQSVGFTIGQVDKEDICELIKEPTFNLQTWQLALKETARHYSGGGKVARAIEVYRAGGTYAAWREKNYPQQQKGNGNNGNTWRNPGTRKAGPPIIRAGGLGELCSDADAERPAVALPGNG